MKGIAAGYADEHVIGEYALIEEGEEAVFAGFYGGDVAGKPCELIAKFFVRFSESPPKFFASFT